MRLQPIITLLMPFILLSCSDLGVKPSGQRGENDSLVENNADSNEIGEDSVAETKEYNAETIGNNRSDADSGDKPILANSPASLTCTPSEEDNASLFPKRMRRLSVQQVTQILREALGDGFPVPELGVDAQPDFGIMSHAGYTIDANFLTLLVSVSQSVANYIIANKETTLVDQFNCGQPVALGKDLCQENFIKYFGRKLFRRPINSEDTNKFMTFFDSFPSATNRERFVLMVEYMLHSPEFLYASEVGGSDKPGVESLVTPIELASMLSLAFTDKGPSDALLESIKNLDVSNKTAVRQFIADYLDQSFQDSTVVTDFFKRFTKDWLNLEDLHIESSAAFNQLNLNNYTPEKLTEDMLTEIEFAAEEVMTHHNGSLDYLLGYQQTKANKALAKIYGLDASTFTMGEFKDAPLDASQRKGILSSAAFIGRNSEGIVHIARGNSLNLDILCKELPAFPNLDKAADVEDAPIPDDDPKKTYRENFEVHSLDPCAACHATIDPPGWAMGNFDNVGMFTELDQPSNKPIDASGKISLASGDVLEFSDGVDFLEKISQTQDVQYCYSKKVYHHFTGSSVTENNICAVKLYTKNFIGSSKNIKELILDILTSDLYLKRR